jgi:hypothetical protein
MKSSAGTIRPVFRKNQKNQSATHVCPELLAAWDVIEAWTAIDRGRMAASRISFRRSARMPPAFSTSDESNHGWPCHSTSISGILKKHFQIGCSGALRLNSSQGKMVVQLANSASLWSGEDLRRVESGWRIHSSLLNSAS